LQVEQLHDFTDESIRALMRPVNRYWSPRRFGATGCGRGAGETVEARIGLIATAGGTEPNYTKEQLRGITAPTAPFDGDHSIPRRVPRIGALTVVSRPPAAR
jgi:hypothetical protein